MPEGMRNLNYFDLAYFIERKIGRKIDFGKVMTIVMLVLFCVLVGTFTKMNHDIENDHRCDHQGPDYVCMNEGKIKVWDDSINDYRYYCEIHK